MTRLGALMGPGQTKSVGEKLVPEGRPCFIGSHVRGQRVLRRWNVSVSLLRQMSHSQSQSWGRPTRVLMAMLVPSPNDMTWGSPEALVCGVQWQMIAVSLLERLAQAAMSAMSKLNQVEWPGVIALDAFSNNVWKLCDKPFVAG